ncbi:MAG: RraA family protein [Proteobacteria bacterium]|nr:RraA family protein [Pseudomonadota bacterium]
MIGYSVHKRKRQVSAEMVAKFKEIPVANISDVMSRITAGGPKLRPMHKRGGLAGPAVTVKTRPGDNLMVHHAFNTASPGDVIVVDAGGDLTNAIVGELMLSHAKVQKLAGVIIHGAVRDYNWINSNEFPVYAGGVTHRGPYKDGPGELNRPIALDGMVVEPGDLIVGDDDGVLCIPFGQVDAVYKAAKAKNDAELRSMEAVLKGTSDRSWVLEALKKGGCEFET